MKVGDLVQYRDRRSTDPQPPGSWGEVGVVVKLVATNFGRSVVEPGIEYMNKDGDFIIARQDDMEVLNEAG